MSSSGIGQAAGPSIRGEGGVVVTEGQQGVAELCGDLAACVVVDRAEPPSRSDRPFDRDGGIAMRVLTGCVFAGEQRVPPGTLEGVSFVEVERQQGSEGFGIVGRRLEVVADTAVQPAALPVGEALVRRIAVHRVPEPIAAVAQRLDDLVELGSRVGGRLDRSDGVDGELTAEDRRHAEQPALLRGQLVDACGDQPLDRIRQLGDRSPCRRAAELDGEQRIAAGTGDDLVEVVVGQRRRRGLESDLADVGVGERNEVEFGDVVGVLDRPPRPVGVVV